MDKPLTDARPEAPGSLPDHNRLEQLEEERRATTGSRFWRRLRSERKALVGALFVAALLIVAIVGPVIAPHDPDADDFMLFESPSMDHPFGTDSFGRDLFSRIIVGARVSVTIGFAAAAVAMVIGVALGL
ncbi:MAG: hypothetical protein M3P94_01325, partial [Chloroflexota bacterium]|nr:hypothetical protein [Chloroflexota bacterium]